MPIFESASSFPSSDYIFKSLIVTAPQVGPNAYKLVLTGTATAGHDTTIAQVMTSVGVCAYGAAVPCEANSGFSWKTGLSVAVLTGQAIQVTVVFSFTSPP